MSSNTCKLIVPLWLAEPHPDFSFFPRVHHNILDIYSNILSLLILLEDFTIFCFLLLPVVMSGT